MNKDIKLMDEIEKNMEVGDSFYSIAVKIPFHNVLNSLLSGDSFSKSFKDQEETLNIICAEQDYLDLKDNGNCDFMLMFYKIEKQIVKKVLKFVKYGKDFTLEDLHIRTTRNTPLDNKIIESFSEFKNDIQNNKSKWLMKCLFFKKYEEEIIAEDNKINKEILSKLEAEALNISV